MYGAVASMGLLSGSQPYEPVDPDALAYLNFVTQVYEIDAGPSSLTAMLGGTDPSGFHAEGMRVSYDDTNRPYAIGALKDLIDAAFETGITLLFETERSIAVTGATLFGLSDATVDEYLWVASTPEVLDAGTLSFGFGPTLNAPGINRFAFTFSRDLGGGSYRNAVSANGSAVTSAGSHYEDTAYTIASRFFTTGIDAAKIGDVGDWDQLNHWEYFRKIIIYPPMDDAALAVLSGDGTPGSVGSAAGTSVAAAVGASSVDSAGAAAGQATASAVGESTSASVGGAAGIAAAAAVGASTFEAVGSAAGTSAAEAVSELPGDGVGTAAGTSTASAVGESTVAATASAAGTGAASGIGASTAEAVGSAAGTSAASGVSPTADAVVAFANFQLPTATGNFQITTADLGGRVPKMAVFCLSNAEVSETAHTVGGEEGFHNFGATDGTSQWSVMSCAESGTNSDNRGYVTTGCLYETNASGTLMLAASFVSFDTNGITIDITTLNTELRSKRGFVQFFAGDDCDVEVGVINGETDGTATKTIGLTSEGVLFSESYTAATGLAGDTATQTFGFALNDGSATQYNAGRNLSTGSGNGRVNNKAAGFGADGRFTCTISFSGADVTATWSSAIEIDLPYAAWTFNGGLTAKASTITSPTSAQQVTASGLGITPTSALFITGPGAVNTTVGSQGFGAGWLTASGGGSMGCLSKTGYCSTTRLNISNGADLGEFEAFASGSLTVDFVTADATARLLPFIAFGT